MKNINYGIDLKGLEEKDDRDLVFGAVEIKDNITLSKPDWSKYETKGEKQHSLYFDSMACVSFSANDSLETIFKYQIENGMISDVNLQWLEDNGYFKDGEINFSDRFTAKMSNTSKNGNTGKRVGQAIREYGLVPETKWDYPLDQRDPKFLWSDFYKTIPQDILDLGQEFKKRFDIRYIQVPREDFKKALKNSPLQVYVYAWGRPVNGVYQYTENTINHAVKLQKPEWFIKDSYERLSSFIKQLATNFKYYSFGYKYIINEIPQEDMKTKLYKKAGSPTCYEKWADGNYYPISDEKYVIDRYGSWDNVDVLEADFEPTIDYVCRSSWVVNRINAIFGTSYSSSSIVTKMASKLSFLEKLINLFK